MLWEAMDYSPPSCQSMVASATWSLVAVVLMEETVLSAFAIKEWSDTMAISWAGGMWLLLRDLFVQVPGCV